MKKNTHNYKTTAKTATPITEVQGTIDSVPAAVAVIKKKAITLLDGSESITSMINSIAKRGSVLEKDIHITATSIINHTELHGDITLANRLIAAIPNLARKNALRDWFQSFGKFGYDTTSQTLTHDKNKTTNLDVAMTTPFWEFKPEPAYQAFDLEKAVAQLLKKAEQRLVTADARDVIDVNKLTALKLVFSTITDTEVETKAA